MSGTGDSPQWYDSRGRLAREGDVSVGPQPEDFSSKGNSVSKDRHRGRIHLGGSRRQ